MTIWMYAILSVFAVSIVSLFGITLLSLNTERLKSVLIVLLAMAAGTLFGDVFIHLLPEAIAEHGFTTKMSLTVLAGITVFFVIEKFIHWHHCHKPEHAKKQTHHLAIMNLVGDAVHNVIDGLVIGASYLVSIPVGIATTIAVFIHEIPQEVSDFAILIHSGFSRAKALFFNFLITLGALAGVIIALYLGSRSAELTQLMIPFAAGAFIYIAGSDLIPELHRETNLKRSLLQLTAFIVGIAIMMGLTFFESSHGHSHGTTHDTQKEISIEHEAYTHVDNHAEDNHHDHDDHH